MSIRQVYLTEDEHYFDTYEEALNHNLLLNKDKVANELTFKDEIGHTIPLEDVQNKLKDICYINICSDMALDYVNMIFSDYAIEFDYIGEYRYRKEDREWISKEEEFDNFKGMWDMFS